MNYAAVAVEAPVYGLFHYRIPVRYEQIAAPGTRVVVPFGKRGISGVIMRVDSEPPSGVEKFRDIEEVLDEPPLPQDLAGLCAWIADYYESPIGEVVRLAFPAGTKISSQQQLSLSALGNTVVEGGGPALARKLRALVGFISDCGGQVSRRSAVQRGISAAVIREAIESELVIASRVVEQPRIKMRKMRMVALGDQAHAGDEEKLRRSAKKYEIWSFVRDEGAGAPVPMPALRDRFPTATAHVRALANDGWLTVSDVEVATELSMTSPLAAAVDAPPLKPAQLSAVDKVSSALQAREFSPFLLHGITGSGKTEVYLHIIEEVLAAGRTAIVLVPEISLTPLLSSRFRARFGEQVAVLHSGLTLRERFEEWRRLRRGDASIALGARSAIYAPVSDLGVIVVDEEHDSSFKQEEGVRYNARDVALVRAQRSGAVCVLGSATPSVESYFAARTGKYRLLEMHERATSGRLPEVAVVDLRVHQADPESMLTAPLASAIEEAAARGEQSILFLNRRGFDTFVVCGGCGYVFRCTECSVSMTYHRSQDRLVCHHCGATQVLTEQCPACHSKGAILRRGFGTEKIANAVQERFPAYRVARLDRDVASGKGITEVLKRFADGEIDILVGTQMVTKGHDFPRVTVVGVLCADTALSLPDFRAGERTFQLLTQVAGRAGRGDLCGRVFIQTYQPNAVPIVSASHQDFLQFFDAEVASRRELGYPPHGHLAVIRFDGENPRAVGELAQLVAGVLRGYATGATSLELLGPCEAPLARLRGRTRWHLWLRAPKRGPLRQALRALKQHAVWDSPQGVRAIIDIDPISSL